MSIAVLYDIHGNLPALEAVLAEIGEHDVDRIVVGGDVVPGPMPTETLTRLMELDVPIQFIRGNGEREVLRLREGQEPRGLPPAVIDVLRWVAEELSEAEAETLRSWPPTLELEVDGTGTVLFCHGTPGSDTEIFTRTSPAASIVPLFRDVSAGVVVCGHTHMQFDRPVGSVRVINAGSVGMPFGEPGAYWLKLGPGVDLRRTEYDLASAAERVRKTKYPQAEEFAAREVLQPRSESEALAMFGRANPEA